MNKNEWNNVGAVAGIVGGVATIHGLTSKQWTRVHTVATGISLLALIGALLSNS